MRSLDETETKPKCEGRPAPGLPHHHHSTQINLRPNRRSHCTGSAQTNKNGEDWHQLRKRAPSTLSDTELTDLTYLTAGRHRTTDLTHDIPVCGAHSRCLRLRAASAYLSGWDAPLTFDNVFVTRYQRSEAIGYETAHIFRTRPQKLRFVRRS